MRKPRDYDAELRALTDKARHLRERKLAQLGELVIATGADALSLEELAGALLALAGTTDAAKREAWRRRGAAFFCGTRPEPRGGAGGDQSGAAPNERGPQPADGEPGTA